MFIHWLIQRNILKNNQRENPEENHENRFRGRDLRSHLAAAIYFFRSIPATSVQGTSTTITDAAAPPPSFLQPELLAFRASTHPLTLPPRVHLVALPKKPGVRPAGAVRSTFIFARHLLSLSLSLLSAPPFWWTFHPRVFFPRFLLRYLLFLHHYSQCVFVSCMRSPCSQHTFPLLLLTLVPLPIGFRCVHRCRPSVRRDANKKKKTR